MQRLHLAHLLCTNFWYFFIYFHWQINILRISSLANSWDLGLYYKLFPRLGCLLYTLQRLQTKVWKTLEFVLVCPSPKQGQTYTYFNLGRVWLRKVELWFNWPELRISEKSYFFWEKKSGSMFQSGNTYNSLFRKSDSKIIFLF